MSVSEDEIVDLLRELVAIPSVNPNFRRGGDPEKWFGEAAIAAKVAAWLEARGLKVETDECRPGRPNVIARLRGRSGRGHLLWEGHLDTVQVTGMTIEPFKATVRAGRLYGRGAVDDKGCLAMFMTALAELAGDPPECDITFLAAVDEEYEFKGVLHHLERGEAYDAGIAGEPTSLRILTACKGCLRWRIEVHGLAAHTSKPEEGVDAIAIATSLLDHMRRRGLDEAVSHPLLGRSSLICTMIEGGEGPNTVPAKVVMTFDYRTLPHEPGPDVWTRFDTITREFARTLPASARLVVQEPFIDSVSMEVPPKAEIVWALQAVCRSFGRSDAITGAPFGSDATKMTRAGIPSVVFGPGSINQAHTADEFVEVAEVATAARMLVALARSWPPAGKTEPGTP